MSSSKGIVYIEIGRLHQLTGEGCVIECPGAFIQGIFGIGGEANGLIKVVAPMAGRVARISLLPGRRLGEIVLFREPGGDRTRHDTAEAVASDSGLIRLLQHAGFWSRFRRRPFGGVPDAGERPAAMLVMGSDTRPFAPDPRHEVTGREEALVRGLASLSRLTDGQVFFCEDAAHPVLSRSDTGPRVERVSIGSRHPQGLAGICLHGLCPASTGYPVWDLHAGDVADPPDEVAFRAGEDVVVVHFKITPGLRQAHATGATWNSA